jgi:MFS family permease
MSQVAVRPGRPAAPPAAARSADSQPSPPRPPAEPDREAPSWRRTFAALRHRDFAVLMASALAHMLAMQMGMVAFGYLAYEISGSATALGLMGLAWGVPMLTLSLVGGVVADRVPRRTILTFTQATVGVGALINAALIYTGQIRLWHLFAIALVQGTCFAFNMPARQALVADLVGPEDLPNAIALNNANMNLTRVLGPAVAGFLIAAPSVGVGGVFLIMAGLYVLVVATILQVRGGRQRAATTRRSGLEQLLEGLAYIRSSQRLLTLLTLGFIPMLLGMHYQMLMPVFALGLLRVGPEGLGLLSMATGLGALVGSLALAALGNFAGKSKVQALLGIGFGLSLVAFALAPSFAVALIVLPIVGATSAAYASLNNTMVMEATPRELYGRVMSVYMMTFSLMPLATVPIARLVDVIGPRPTVAASGALLAYVVAVIAFGALVRLPRRAPA